MDQFICEQFPPHKTINPLLYFTVLSHYFSPLIGWERALDFDDAQLDDFGYPEEDSGERVIIGFGFGEGLFGGKLEEELFFNGDEVRVFVVGLLDEVSE